MTRDILVDLQKGLQLTDKKKKYRRTEIKVSFHQSYIRIPHFHFDQFQITEIQLLGSGSFDNLTLSTYEHMAQFYDSAEWFVKNQNPKTGGWANPVKRKLSEFNELKKGWYSAMGQGHGISVLARAYHHSGGDVRYLNAALNAIKPFSVPSRQGGVLTKFMGKSLRISTFFMKMSVTFKYYLLFVYYYY